MTLPVGQLAGLAGGILGKASSRSTSIVNTIVTLVVLGGEYIVSRKLFQCPCGLNVTSASYLRHVRQMSYYSSPFRVLYALSFIVWPSVALFAITLSINNETKRCLAINTRHCNCRRHCRSLLYLVQKSASSLVAPSAWLILVFMDGRYLECIMAKIPTDCLPDSSVAPNDTVAQQNIAWIQNDNAHWVAVSQIVAWTIIGVGVILAVLFTLCSQFCSRTTYYQMRFTEMFRQKEMETFHQVAEELLQEDLQSKWKAFLSKARTGDWEEISVLPYGGPERIDERFYYSAFHKWEPDSEPNAPLEVAIDASKFDTTQGGHLAREADGEQEDAEESEEEEDSKDKSETKYSDVVQGIKSSLPPPYTSHGAHRGASSGRVPHSHTPVEVPRRTRPSLKSSPVADAAGDNKEERPRGASSVSAVSSEPGGEYKDMHSYMVDKLIENQSQQRVLVKETDTQTDAQTDAAAMRHNEIPSSRKHKRTRSPVIEEQTVTSSSSVTETPSHAPHRHSLTSPSMTEPEVTSHSSDKALLIDTEPVSTTWWSRPPVPLKKKSRSNRVSVLAPSGGHGDNPNDIESEI